jgi:transcriptional regulator GlxA family with amidase domain
MKASLQPTASMLTDFAFMGSLAANAETSQKRLRLLRARWLLLLEPRDAASIAFAVGYESASQFSREYARFFGMRPARDMARFKASVVSGRATAGIEAVA